jgi:hypothetical protein
MTVISRLKTPFGNGRSVHAPVLRNGAYGLTDLLGASSSRRGRISLEGESAKSSGLFDPVNPRTPSQLDTKRAPTLRVVTRKVCVAADLRLHEPPQDGQICQGFAQDSGRSIRSAADARAFDISPDSGCVFSRPDVGAFFGALWGPGEA